MMAMKAETCSLINKTRQDIDDNITRRMRIAGWLNKATDTPSEQVANTYCISR